MAWRYPESPLYRFLSFPKPFHNKFGDRVKDLALSGFYVKKFDTKRLFCAFKYHSFVVNDDTIETVLSKHKCHADEISDIPVNSENLYLNYSSHRLYTFVKNQNWQVENLSSFIAAESGLFYTGTAQICRCHFCGVEIKSWPEDETAFNLHKRANPLCACVHNFWSNGNVRFGQDVNTEIPGVTLLDHHLGKYYICEMFLKWEYI